MRPPPTNLEAFLAVEPTELLVVHGDAFAPEQDGEPPIAKPPADAFVGTNAFSWHIAGTGDFNGDGKADMLHNDSGAVDLLTMNGGQIVSEQLVGTTATSWHVLPPHYDLI